MPNERTAAFTKILVATDLSASADEAILQAHELATNVGAELVICHVIPAYHRNNPLFPQRNEADALSTVDLERRVAELVTTRVCEVTGRSAQDFRLTIDTGKAETGILQAALNMGVDLVALGNRGDTDLSRVLLGGVSERVVQHAHCSVLIARPTSKRGLVLAATDLSDASFPAITAGACEAERRGAKLVVMHNLDIWPMPISSVAMPGAMAGLTVSPALIEEQRAIALQSLKDLLLRLGVDATAKITHGAPDTGIVTAADELEPELLVIGTHGRTGLARIALGSVAERVIETANCSVLVVRIDEAS
jgi:nucleotide-binding universal stress UspA family protein